MKDVHHKTSLEKASNVFNISITTDKTNKTYIMAQMLIARINVIQTNEFTETMRKRSLIDLTTETEADKDIRVMKLKE